jgi:hypothetical protein
MARVLASLAAIATLSAGPLGAQESDFPAGTRVRVHASGATIPLTGTVAWRDATHLAVRRASGDTAIVAVSALTRVDVSRGRQSNVLRGARTGALVGAGAGLVLGLAAMGDNDSFFDYGPEIIPISMLGGGFMGGSVGLLIGAFTTSEQWSPTDPALTIRPGFGTVAVGATLTF